MERFFAIRRALPLPDHGADAPKSLAMNASTPVVGRCTD